MAKSADRARLARALKALAHPSRLGAVRALAAGPLCVQELQAVMGSELSTVSRHLRMLADAGLLDPERQGQRIVYRLKVPCLNGFLECVEAVLAGRPNRELAERLVKEMVP
ncbi:MAG TPA: metalloregulator ArsR/SmtB family transcription factor [Planctomycetota bacterium]|nr:metalloregulator ArsR/SmtB family transcription factor [Planctomycetota bacterium]